MQARCHVPAFLLFPLILTLTWASHAAAQTAGVLRLCRGNPRYFVDAGGDVVWLTGSHTWANLQERGVEGDTPDFDYESYLDFLESHDHNFIRLWAWEHTRWMQFVDKDVPIRYRPNPYKRTGPGLALDGGPKFDLTEFNDAYFERLRRRVKLARRRGIYVSVMFFQGFSLDKRGNNKTSGNAWHGHPFHRANNVNGIDGNPSGDDRGHEVHELAVVEITRLQEKYVRKVIETVGDLDNVLWEIGNECHRGSVEWQYHMIRFIKECESNRPVRHPVGMTGAPIGTEELLASPADWISPPGEKWLTDPPANNGAKVVLVDSDHCAPWDQDPDWVWKNLFRGNQFILMDGYVDYRLGSPERPNPDWDRTRRAMGKARQVAEGMELARLVPDAQRASTGYCLATPADGGQAFRCYVYLPDGGEVTVDLSEVTGKLSYEFVDPRSAVPCSTGKVDGGRRRRFAAPLPGPVILKIGV